MSWSAPRPAPRCPRCWPSRSSRPTRPRWASTRWPCTTPAGAGQGGRRSLQGRPVGGLAGLAWGNVPEAVVGLARPLRPLRARRTPAPRRRFMRLDAAAQRALHVFPARGDANGTFSLYGLMCRARTAMGKRRLKVGAQEGGLVQGLVPWGTRAGWRAWPPASLLRQASHPETR
jgi:hypothetical protein